MAFWLQPAIDLAAFSVCKILYIVFAMLGVIENGLIVLRSPGGTYDIDAHGGVELENKPLQPGVR